MSGGFRYLALPLLLLGMAAPAAPAQQPDTTKEEAALFKKAEAFAAAFNKGDAKAVAAFYTANADVVNIEGEHVKGRKAIEEDYQKLFSEVKGAKLTIQIKSVRIAGPALALEDGVTEVAIPGGPPSVARYSVVYVKVDGDWYIESVREAVAMPPTNAKYLQDIAFLIGDWVEDVEKGGSSHASYAWAQHGNFIVNTFELTLKDIPVGGGTQWIGWDAAAKKPRSWAFVFNGGFAEGVWNKDGNNWKVQLTATLADGKKLTATNLLTRIDADHFSMQFIDRTLDGKQLPDEKAIKMKRAR